MSISLSQPSHNQDSVFSDQDEQESTQSRLAECEQLLDLAGLLEIEKLIRNIKKEGRLKGVSDKRIGHKD